jgi:hypothetical protein
MTVDAGDRGWVSAKIPKEAITPGSTLYLALAPSPHDDSMVKFRAKEGASLDTVTSTKVTETSSHSSDPDTVSGDVYVNGNVDISDAEISGDIKATGDVSGEPTSHEYIVEDGYDEIPPPDLSRESEWYESLGVGKGGLVPDPDNTNPDVVFDGSDGKVDGEIAGIITTHDKSGEKQDYMGDYAKEIDNKAYVLDDYFGKMAGRGDPNYDKHTDSVIVSVPEQFNNKAVYIPGDFWIDILDPTHIDFRVVDKNGKSTEDKANLTFIVEGNTYMTDGINTGVHPDAVPGGTISVI